MKITILEEARVVMSNYGSIHDYFGWPTVKRLRNGRLALGASGYRMEHICPFGKAVLSFSENEGKTWTVPAPIIDTVLDDRDTGLCPFGQSGLIITSFNNTRQMQMGWLNGHINRRTEEEKDYVRGYLSLISDEQEKAALGSTYKVSYDNGVTFGPLQISPVTSPHGPIELRDGRILWVGTQFYSQEGHSQVDAYEMDLQGNMRKIGSTGYYQKIGEDIEEVQENIASVGKDDVEFDIELLPSQIQAESICEPDRDNNYNFKYRYDTLKANQNASLIQKIQYQMTNTRFLSFFSDDPNMYNLLEVIDEFVHLPEESLYIDTSQLGASEGIGGMVIDLVSTFVMSRDDIKPFVFFIDEVHRYAKSRYSDKEYHGGLTLLAREGRKKGIFLYLTTQNPKDVSPILFGQVGTMLIHRLMLNDEIHAVESHLDDYAIKHVRKLNQGEVILTSVNLLHNMFIHVNKSPRTQHNDTPQL